MLSHTNRIKKRKDKVHIGPNRLPHAKLIYHAFRPLVYASSLCRESHCDSLDLGRQATPHGRAGDGVAGQGRVDVDQDAWRTRFVKGGTLLANGASRARVFGARAGELDIKALGVVLRSVGLLGAVKGDDFVTEDEFAGLNVGRDLDSPGVVIGCGKLACRA